MAKSPRIPRSDEDLKAELFEQLDLMRHACEAFDEGKLAFGKHIALGLRVLLHSHGNNTRALLDQLKMLSMPFFDTAGDIPPGNLLADMPLIMLQAGPNGGRYLPQLHSGHYFGRERWIGFTPWWNNTVLRLQDGTTFSRYLLIKNVANTDGGAHVDPGLEEAYMALSRKNALGWVFSTSQGDTDFGGRPELAHIRQIAQEFLTSVSQYYPEYAEVASPPIPSKAYGT